MPDNGKPAVYLTFDDGPHPEATVFVLERLKAAGAKATFFCIGKCVEEFPDVYSTIINDGHSIGNHTFNHLNGWKTSTDRYMENIAAANAIIPSRAFRPPYGRIKREQASALFKSDPSWKIYMWTILSGDFDVQLSPEKCLENVLNHIRPGAIVVFHDSAKAWERLRYALPFVIDYCREQGWEMNALPMH
jgi:peptidoglycan/xylan/chitin deacetylase (PgdA/CDA1 family)